MTNTKIVGPSGLNLLTYNNAKTIKGIDKGYFSFILYLSPAKLSGYNVCPKASQGCIASCLNTAGQGIFSNVQAARIRKTKLFFEDRNTFISLLERDILLASTWAVKHGYTPCFRLNGTSDLRWETTGIIQKFPNLQFYDYTKLTNRKDLPDNYHLTYSRSEDSTDEVMLSYLSQGINVAVVFDKVPLTYLGFPVVNGDEDDLRFLDKQGVVIGLKAKGKARKDTSGFVIINNVTEESRNAA